MKFSRALKSSAHALPSPDGAYIATILTSKLILRSTRSLEIFRVIAFPTEIASSIQWFLWSPSSKRVLVCASDCICVYSTASLQFAAKISNPTSGTTKITSIAFGGGTEDDEILVFADFGLKLTVFNLSTSTSIEIASPKFYGAGNSSRGCAYRPRTSSLALLTRSGGKDVVSIHARHTYEVLRSWNSDTVDAQGISWSPDGRWLAVVDSAGQGPRILFYTADGHLFKVWNGPTPIRDKDRDSAMGAGLKMFEWAATGDYLAVGDYSSRIALLSAPSFAAILSLNHTITIKPVSGLQIWQEQVTTSPSGGFDRTFALCTNPLCPPTTGSSPPATHDPHAKSGTNILTIDTSGTLIASRCETMPTTIWIWDTASKVLKAIMVLHAPIAKATWHPSINELLLIRCEGEESKGLAHLWEPTWPRPQIVDFASQVPEGKIIGKSVVRWLNCADSSSSATSAAASASPALFFSDAQDCMLASLAETDDEDLPWRDAVGAAGRGFDIYGQREESPLDLVAAAPGGKRARLEALMNGEPTMTGMSGGMDEVEDTFRFKKFVDP